MAAHEPSITRSQEPSPELALRDLPLLQLVGSLYRIHRTEHSPLFFGRTGRNRFDSPFLDYGVLYAALEPDGSFIESFGDSAGNLVSRSGLAERSISTLEIDDSLNVVDITGSGLARVGAAGEVTAGEHPLAQRWSQAFFEHRQNPDGIYYRARHDQDLFCVALFDRESTRLKTANSIPLMHHDFAPELGRILDKYDFGLV